MLLFPLFFGCFIVFVFTVVVEAFALDVVVAKYLAVVFWFVSLLLVLEPFEVVVYVHESAVASCPAPSLDVEPTWFGDCVGWVCPVLRCCSPWCVCWRG